MANDTEQKGKSIKLQDIKSNFVNPSQATPTISAAPDETVWSVLQSAYISGKYAVGSSPLTFLDRAAAGLRDLTVRGLRGSLLSKEADSSVVSTIRDTWIAAYKLVDAFRGVSGDEKIAAKLEEATEKYFSGRSRPQEFGEYDIYMAAGWKPKGPIKINGKMVNDPPEITNMLAVFVRNANGEVEILDPSQKVESVKGLGKLFSALWDDPKDEIDKKWQQTAGTFVKWQLAPMLPSLLTGGGALLGKAPGMSSKISVATSVLDKVSSSSAVRAIGAVGVVSNSGDAYDLGKGLLSGVLTRAELDKLAEGMTKILTSSKIMSKNDLSGVLNSVLEDYSYKEGSNTKQMYIPSLKGSDNPWDRFRTLLLGRVDGFQKSNSPWDKWDRKDQMFLGDVQEAMRSNPQFKLASLKVCEKALTGQALDDREYFILRVQLNAGGERNFPLFGAGKESNLKFTVEERKETLDALREDLSKNLKQYTLEHPREGKKNYGIEIKTDKQEFSFAAALKLEMYSDAQLLKFVRSDIADLQKQQTIDQQKLQAQSMAFAMH